MLRHHHARIVEFIFIHLTMLFQIISIPFMIATIGQHITNDVFSHNLLVKIEIVKKYLSIRPIDWSLVEWQSDKPGTSIVTVSQRWVLLLTVYKRGFITKHQITKQIFQVVHWVCCLFNHIRNLLRSVFLKNDDYTMRCLYYTAKSF